MATQIVSNCVTSSLRHSQHCIAARVWRAKMISLSSFVQDLFTQSWIFCGTIPYLSDHK